MDYIIRPATAKDEPIVWEMLRYASHEPSVEFIRNQPNLACYALNWGRTKDLGCIAEKNKLPVGMAWLRLWLTETKGYAYVNDEIPELAIAVLPDFRGRGIGTDLLMQILEMAKAHYPGVSLSVRASNPVLSLYERVGFERVAGSEVINRVNEVSFTMMLEFR